MYAKSKVGVGKALIEKYNRQMDNVKNNREYEALSKEIELQKLEIQLSEKKLWKISVNNLTRQLSSSSMLYAVGA